MNDGWLLKNDNETAGTTFRAFFSREGAIEEGVPQYQPKLIVSYTPAAAPAAVPAAGPSATLAGLLGIGALVVARRARPRR